MFKKVINIFLILILSVQVLPVQQMGAALFSNQFTEEIPHSLDVEKDGFKKMQGKSEFLDWANPDILFITIPSEEKFIHNNESLPHNHTNEILVPPPNC
jgi:hypothetical protein